MVQVLVAEGAGFETRLGHLRVEGLGFRVRGVSSNRSSLGYGGQVHGFKHVILPRHQGTRYRPQNAIILLLGISPKLDPNFGETMRLCAGPGLNGLG